MKLLCPALLMLLASSPAEALWSAHRKGPHGLEGWERTEVKTGLEKQGPLPVALLLARKGHVFRSISGDPFVWNWQFQVDGRRVAFEAGLLHFSMQCSLEDVDTGEVIATYDCSSEPLPADAPPWVRSLEEAGHAKGN